MDKYELMATLGERELAHRKRAHRAPEGLRRRVWLWLASRRRRERLSLIYAEIHGARSPLVMPVPVREVDPRGGGDA